MPEEVPTAVVDIDAFTDVRRQALLAHATQVDPESKFWFGLPPEVMDTIHPHDDYRLALVGWPDGTVSRAGVGRHGRGRPVRRGGRGVRPVTARWLTEGWLADAAAEVAGLAGPPSLTGTFVVEVTGVPTAWRLPTPRSPGRASGGQRLWSGRRLPTSPSP